LWRPWEDRALPDCWMEGPLSPGTELRWIVSKLDTRWPDRNPQKSCQQCFRAGERHGRLKAILKSLPSFDPLQVPLMVIITLGMVLNR
jgi:hypothetical protein